MNRVRLLAVSAAAFAAVGGLAACTSTADGNGSSAPAASTPAPVTTTVDTTVVASPPASTSGASDGSSSAPSGTSQCAESQLRASVEADDLPGVNRHVVKLFFKNKSGSTCTLTGFPGAATVDVKGNQEQQAKRVVGGVVGGTIEKSTTITLRSGVTAYAWLEGASTREQGSAQAGCDGPGFPRILVTPPNTDIPVPFTIGWPLCYTLNVHPVRLDG